MSYEELLELMRDSIDEFAEQLAANEVDLDDEVVDVDETLSELCAFLKRRANDE